MCNRWYVVQTKPKNEYVVMRNLEKTFTCFLPQIQRERIFRGKSVRSVDVLFPTYLFVQMDIEVDRWRDVANVRGVRKLMGVDPEEYIPPLPVGFIEGMLKCVDNKGFITLPKVERVLKKFLPGDEVRINSGIFEGLTGIYVNNSKAYTTILLTLLSGEVEVKFPIELVSIK